MSKTPNWRAYAPLWDDIQKERNISLFDSESAEAFIKSLCKHEFEKAAK
jgi:hypothetical protein